jgi:hypothetical protein
MNNINKEWHHRNKMPKNPTFEERVKWHTAHELNCNCRTIPKQLLNNIKKIKKDSKIKN